MELINIDMIIHKRFQKNYNSGSIEVQVNFNVNDKNIEVTNIQIHENFDSGIPNSPIIEEINNRTFLVESYTIEKGRNVIHRMVDNVYANDIVSEIMRLKSEIETN
jgi:hypothetical protein